MSLTWTGRAVLVAALMSPLASGCNALLGVHEPAHKGDSGLPATIGDGGSGGADAHAADAKTDATADTGTVTCSAGQLRCNAGRPQKCNASGLGYEDQDPCPTTAPTCDLATGKCVKICTAADQRCNPTAPVIQQCDQTGLWQDTITRCSYLCSGTGPTTGCTGTCIPGTRRCGANDTPFLCDDTGTDQPQAQCPNLCAGGACTGDCKPNSTRCVAGMTNMVQVCSGTGSWGPASACTFVCDSTIGACGGECVPGSPPGCAGNTVKTCDATGHLQTTMTCTGVTCSKGQCLACTASQKQCNAGKPQTCSSTGVWLDDQSTACSFYCDPAKGTCSGECVPGTDLCTSLVSKHCGSTGMYDAGTTCTNICDSTTGRCGGVCPPNSHRCNAQSSETCGANGQWASAPTCPFGCNQTTGLCNACTDEPVATTCGGGKCGPIANNCAHSVQCPGCTGTGESCSGGGVAGVCGCRPEAAAQTCQNGLLCGNVANNCGLIVPCASNCVAPQTCGGGTTPNTCGCTPKTKAVACAGKNCDGVADGCGGTINCGACTGPATCAGATPSVANVCGCTPKTASALCGTRNCGTMPDGCNGIVACGTMSGNCASGMVCSNGTCASTCTPMTACPTAKNCGTIDNGCSTGMLICGTMSGNCPSGQTCSGGNPGTPNVCGCTPLTMSAACAGKCGQVGDGCAGTIPCTATCPPNQTCGGGGTPNVCGCKALTQTMACANKDCGTVGDGCGGTLTCGTTCPPNQTCAGGGVPNKCGCTPLTAAKACPVGQNCSTALDGCGGTVSCGTCTGLQTCGGAGTPGQCGCKPITSCPSGTNCGTLADGCNGPAINCGSAICGTGANQGCGATTANLCGCTRNPTSMTCSGKCGNVTDNCGTVVPCQVCASSLECAQAPATPVNVCCTPETDPQMCARMGKVCGPVTAPDNCGFSRTIAVCGPCVAPKTCSSSGACGCVDETDQAFCTRLHATCGSITATNNCGASHTATCLPGCAATQVCEGPTAPAPNTCCTPLTACTGGRVCGTMPDNCGGTITCGTLAGRCPGVGQVCSAAGTCSCPGGTTELCNNGVDDNCDGLIDCADPQCTGAGYQCAALPPSGWLGPVSFWNGPNGTVSPACPANFQTPTAYLSGLSFNPAICTCGCVVGGGTVCSAGDTVNFIGGNDCGQITPPQTVGTSCTPVNIPLSQFGHFPVSAVGLSNASGTVCSITGTAAGGGAPTISTKGQLCNWGLQLDHGGCSATQQCVGGVPTNQLLCVYQAGTVATCPAGYSTSGPFSYFTSTTDDRKCPACACTSQSAACNTNFTVFQHGDCTGASQNFNTSPASCTSTGFNGLNFTPDAPASAVITGTSVFDGLCITTNATPPGTGAVTATGQITICCR